MKELTVQEAALAWAQGKRVEAMGPTSLEWAPVIKVGGGDGEWSPGVFTARNPNYRFRIATEPPAKKFRPWSAEEVPVGAVTRPKCGGDVLMIVGRFSSVALLAGDGGMYPFGRLLERREHSIDGGKTWTPCGVEVTE